MAILRARKINDILEFTPPTLAPYARKLFIIFSKKNPVWQRPPPALLVPASPAIGVLQ
jgi:hypothetical protein